MKGKKRYAPLSGSFPVKALATMKHFPFQTLLFIDKLTNNELTLTKGSLTINYNKR